MNIALGMLDIIGKEASRPSFQHTRSSEKASFGELITSKSQTPTTQKEITPKDNSDNKPTNSEAPKDHKAKASANSDTEVPHQELQDSTNDIELRAQDAPETMRFDIPQVIVPEDTNIEAALEDSEIVLEHDAEDGKRELVATDENQDAEIVASSDFTPDLQVKHHESSQVNIEAKADSSRAEPTEIIARDANIQAASESQIDPRTGKPELRNTEAETIRQPSLHDEHKVKQTDTEIAQFKPESSKEEAQIIATDSKTAAEKAPKEAKEVHKAMVQIEQPKIAVAPEVPKIQAPKAESSTDDVEFLKDVESVQVVKAEPKGQDLGSNQNEFNGESEQQADGAAKISDKFHAKANGVTQIEVFAASSPISKSVLGANVTNLGQSFETNPRAVANQISENIIQHASASNNDTFTIKLNPESLGEIEVQMVASREGKIDAIKLTVKEPETLKLIAESQRELMDSLQKVSDIEDAALSFNLKEGGEQGSNAKHQQSMHEFFQNEAEYNSGAQKVLAQKTPILYNHGHQTDPLHEGISITL